MYKPEGTILVLLGCITFGFKVNNNGYNSSS